MAYNKKIVPKYPTGCGNHECPRVLRDGCTRYMSKTAHYTSVFNPSRLADGRISCAMRITKGAA